MQSSHEWNLRAECELILKKDQSSIYGRLGKPHQNFNFQFQNKLNSEISGKETFVAWMRELKISPTNKLKWIPENHMNHLMGVNG